MGEPAALAVLLLTALGELAFGLWPVLVGVLMPGGLLLRAAGLWRGGRLERLVLAAAVGRVALAVVALAAAELGVLGTLPFAGLGVCLLYAFVLRREGRRHPRPGLGALLPPLAVSLAALALVLCVGGHSGLPEADGSLGFFGNHSTNDTLFYAGIARRLEVAGLPLDNPFAADWPQRAHYVFFGSLIGLRAVADADLLDTAFRVRPALDVVSAALGAGVVARRLGAGTPGAIFAGLALLFATGIDEPLLAAARALGAEPVHLEAWAFGGGHLLPVNPMAAALGSVFALLLVLSRLPQQAGRRALLAALLLTAILELKIFLWPALFGGLLGVALFAPPVGLARALRQTSAAAFLFAAPLWLEKILLGRFLEDRATVAFAPCPGCLPRFMLDSLLAPEGLSLEVFQAVGAAQLTSPVWWLGSIAASLGFLAILLGARLLALPVLVGALREVAQPPGCAALLRVLCAAAFLGLGAACVLAPAPHYFDAAQFAWLATHGLAPLYGLWLGRAWLRRPFGIPVVLLLVALGASGVPRWVVERGLLAPRSVRLAQDEMALLERFQAASQPGDLVVEPSLLIEHSRLSPVPWRTGRPVLLSKSGVGETLVDPIRNLRQQVIETVFQERDADAVVAALRAVEARWVYAPATRPLRCGPDPRLVPQLRSPAGTFYRLSD